MIIDKEDLLKERTPQEIAERFGICVKTVKALQKSGMIRSRIATANPDIRLKDRARIHRRSTFQDYINYQQSGYRKRGQAV